MGLLRRFIRNDLADLHARNVRIRVIGVNDGLSADIIALLDEAEKLTSANTGLTFVVAFNYGSRREITDAVRSIAFEIAAGRLNPAEITEEMIASRLNTAGIPDPDLVVRTSGEQRLSNFLLWQSSYSELVFSPVLWPDFGHDALMAAIDAYRVRDRRFGGLPAAIGGSR